MNNQTNRQFLVISALGKDRPGIVNQLTVPITENGCNILDSRMTVLGGEFAMLLLVEGSWSAIAKLESQMSSAQERLDLTIIHKRTTEHPDAQQAGLPYTVNVVALDHPGIVNQLAKFFSSRNINIHECYTDSYQAAHTGTPMFSANLTINIPPQVHIAALREEFLDFCDSLNLDAIFEPFKG